MASANCEQKAEINAAAEWNQMLFDNDFLLPEKYTPKKNEIINAPVSQSTKGTCNGKPYECNVGDILNKCSSCPEYVAELQIKKQFINEYVRKKCNNSTEPTATSGATASDENNQPSGSAAPKTTSATTTSVTPNCKKNDMNLLLSTYCDDEGYISTNKKAYGTYSTTKNSIKFGCYKYRNHDITNLKKEVANTCGISETQVTILNNLERDSNQINKSTKKLAKPSGVTCGMNRNLGILKEEDFDGVCAPTECLTPRWELSGRGKRAKCVEQKCEFKHGTGEWTPDGNTWKCTLTTCKNGYDKNENGNACIEQLKKCTDDQIQQLPNATKTGLKKGTQTCIAQECKCGFKLKNDACVEWAEDEPCTADTKPALPRNANSAIMKCDGKKAYCEITACKDGYKHDTEKNKCSRDGESDADEEDDMDAPSNDEDKKTEPNEPSLSETDSQAKIDELRDNAEAMRAKEQSTANKLLGAAAIGTTGIGAMQTASAMAEQNADADAERTMRAYLATFHCDYGAGKSIQGGQSNIDLPGGNELIGLYSEYVNLANDLKVRKNALNIRPGIESEPILDAATSGLYDDVAIGKTSGAYTSLARALMDPNGADAAAWAQQKSDTADRKKAGMITAGIGVAGSLAANLAINHFENKKSKILTELQTEIADIPPQTAPCPNGTTGDQHPNCTCNDKIYNPNSKSCEPCPGNQIVNNNNCQCPANLPLWDTEQNKCIARPVSCTPQCTPTEGDHLIVLQDCSCTCDDGYNYKNGQCVCESPKQFLAPSGECVNIVTQQVTVPKITNNYTYTIVSTHTTVDKASLPAGSLFKIGSAELLDQAKQPLDNFIAQLSESGYTDCKISITGYTDPVGNPNNNLTLSRKRAQAVEDYFNGKKAGNKLIETISSTGLGEANCTCGAGKLPDDASNTINGQKINYNDSDYKICKGQDSNYPLSGNVRYAPCRRVDITVNCDHNTTQTTTQTTTYTTTNE